MSLGWSTMTRYLDDGRPEIDNNAAERVQHGVALGCKNWLFAGSDKGGVRVAAIYSLIETGKLGGLDPEAYLCDVLTCIADHTPSIGSTNFCLGIGRYGNVQRDAVDTTAPIGRLRSQRGQIFSERAPNLPARLEPGQ